MLAFSHSYPLSIINLKWFWTRKSTLRSLLNQPATAWVKGVLEVMTAPKERMVRRVHKVPKVSPVTKD